MVKSNVSQYMDRVMRRSDRKKGLSPDSLVFVGSQRMEAPLLRLMTFDETTVSEATLGTLEDLPDVKSGSVTWLNVDGVHVAETIRDVGRRFNLNTVLQAKIMRTGQRPRIAEYDNVVYFVLNMLRFDKESGEIVSEQISIVVGDSFLLTFQEQRGDVFDPVRERIRKGRKRIRRSGADYLAYALLDILSDNYIDITEVLGAEIEKIEDELAEESNTEILTRINRYKKEVNLVRRQIRPVRELLIQAPKLESQLIQDETIEVWSGVRMQVIQANESIDAHRDMLNDELNLYHSIMSAKMNDVMKVLTIFSAIFIPLTFIAGIYGTNFEVLPELRYENSYYIMLIVMIIVVVVMLGFFKKKGWF